MIGFEQGGGPAPWLKLSVEPVGPEIEGGINKSTLFDIDDSTRIWQKRQLVSREAIKSGSLIQVNLTWGPFDSLATTDVWLDEKVQRLPVKFRGTDTSSIFAQDFCRAGSMK